MPGNILYNWNMYWPDAFLESVKKTRGLDVKSPIQFNMELENWMITDFSYMLEMWNEERDILAKKNNGSKF